jgi:hypothetical protein
MIIQSTLNEIINDYDWREVFSFADFSFNDVKEIIGLVNGSNDYSDWVGIFLLKDGQYGYVSAGCDYTGWGCRDWGDSLIAESLTELEKHITQDEMSRLLGNQE